MAATLAAFNIADELYRTSEEFKDLKLNQKDLWNNTIIL